MRIPAALRAAVSLVLLALVATALEPGEVLDRLRSFDLGWLGVALALSALQVLVSAWRWRFTAGRLGAPMALRAAVAEYYLATFLNQVLPGGVLGDVSRAVRHARGGTSESVGTRAVHAVLLERGSGQVVMAAVAIVSAAWLFLPPSGTTTLLRWGTGAALGLAAMAVAAAVLRHGTRTGLGSRLSGRLRAVRALMDDGHRALVADGALLPQLVASFVVVSTYVLTYLAAARAVDSPTSTLTLLPLVAPVLLAMLLPVSVAGWGVREAAAAALWGAVGLSPADGVAISVAYGVLVLVGGLPGSMVLVLDLMRPSGPDRTARLTPGRSDGWAVEGPRPASPPEEAGSQAGPTR